MNVKNFKKCFENGLKGVKHLGGLFFIEHPVVESLVEMPRGCLVKKDNVLRAQ